MNLTESLITKAADKLKSVLVPVASRIVKHQSLVGDKTFFEPKVVFPWVADMEREWPSIRAEMDHVRSSEKIPGLHEITPALEFLAGDNKWKTFFLIANQARVVANCAKCPRTSELLSRIPGVNSAFFSILLPGKHIPAHEGVYNGLLRYHLGLKMPQDPSLCAIRVGSDIRSWGEGKSLLFDDCFEHEAWNRAGEERAVLIVDVLRPLSFPLSELNKAIVHLTTQTSFARDARKTLENMTSGQKAARRAP